MISKNFESGSQRQRLYRPEYLTGLFGTDTEVSLSPAIHNKIYEKINLPAVYKDFSLEPSQLSRAFEAIKTLSFRGINLTYPFKIDILPMLDQIDDSAEKIGAVNTVKIEDDFAAGYNTDFLAIKKLLAEWFSREKKDLNALLVGAGGAARSVAMALNASFFENVNITIANRTLSRAENLVEDIIDSERINSAVIPLKRDDIMDSLSEIELVIDATPLGWQDEMFPGAKGITADHKIFDLSYSSPPSKLLKLAENKGAERENGTRMLVYQAEAAHEIWFEPTEFALDIIPENRYITM